MTDYVEGHIEMKRILGEMYKALLEGKYREAREMCNQMVVAARLTRAQIGMQEER